MPRRLLALNLLLAVASALLLAYVVREATVPAPVPIGGRRAGPPPGPTPVVETPRPAAGAYAVVASRNVFSPARTESTAPGSAAVVSAAVKPNLFGVVVRDGGSIAYLEDPATKRVAGYRVGDSIVGGTLQTIRGDSVVIARPDGDLDVRLHDPSRPRTVAGPPAGPAAMPTAGVSQPPAGSVIPGVVPPIVQPPATPAPGRPGAPPTLVPGRRPLPPNLIRRLPTGTGDATQQ